jgi:hypothetical protein
MCSWARISLRKTRVLVHPKHKNPSARTNNRNIKPLAKGDSLGSYQHRQSRTLDELNQAGESGDHPLSCLLHSIVEHTNVAFFLYRPAEEKNQRVKPFPLLLGDPLSARDPPVWHGPFLLRS